MHHCLPQGVRKQAEISIKNLSVQPNFGLTVLKVCATTQHTH